VVAASSAAGPSTTAASNPSSSGTLAFTGSGPYAPVLAEIGIFLLTVGVGLRYWLLKRRARRL